MDMQIGKVIKRRRKELNMSVDALAEKIGKDRSTIYRYEKGNIGSISVDMLPILANALDMTIPGILGIDMSHPETYEQIHSDLGLEKVITIHRIKAWVSEFGHAAFTDEEMDEIRDYARYLVYKRELEQQRG